jgi:hypothetical protein
VICNVELELQSPVFVHLDGVAIKDRNSCPSILYNAVPVRGPGIWSTLCRGVQWHCMPQPVAVQLSGVTSCGVRDVTATAHLVQFDLPL